MPTDRASRETPRLSDAAAQRLVMEMIALLQNGGWCSETDGIDDKISDWLMSAMHPKEADRRVHSSQETPRIEPWIHAAAARLGYSEAEKRWIASVIAEEYERVHSSQAAAQRQRDRINTLENVLRKEIPCYYCGRRFIPDFAKELEAGAAQPEEK